MTPEEFFGVLASMPQPVAQVHRLYHDEQGGVLFYSMEDLPGTWIEVDAATYATAPHAVRVISGSLVRLPKQMLIDKLRPAEHGICCHPQDVCIVVSPDQPHVKWSVSCD